MLPSLDLLAQDLQHPDVAAHIGVGSALKPMDDDGKPEQSPLRVVAENTEADKARLWATRGLSWALRDLAANLLRIVRGAGKPHEIGQQAEALLKAYIEYHEAFGHYPPSYDLTEILSTERSEEWRNRLKGSELSRVYAVEQIVAGSLQIAASRLVGQTTQERAGDSELYAGVRALEAAQEEGWREQAAKATTHKPPPRRPRTPKG